MFKNLPKVLSFEIRSSKFEILNFFILSKRKFALILILLLAFSFLFYSIPKTTFAQTPTPTPAGWQPDDEVSFVGKTASRSGDFLDWTLQNYSWLCVTKVAPNQCDNKNDPLIPFWIIIRNIVYALIALFVLATAFILIITRGQNITIMRFIPRFVLIILLITFSFSLVQFIYQVCDIIQDFFLRVAGNYISTKDLLFIGFDYTHFEGYRIRGPAYDESAFISLLLVRLTAITYYVMTGVLLIRKIILWFFIIISPVFPLLIFYRPIRNTAKIWVGEFFRWLLYAPLFAIFLHGLVIVWQRGIPLAFDFSGAQAGEVVYPTAVNILLGGPLQSIGLTNSVNLRDTFAEYVVALLMLWIVILLPFLLLKIFLDYINTLSFGAAGFNFRQIMNRNTNVLQPPGGGVPPAVPPSPPGLTQPGGLARALPFFASRGAAVKPVEVASDLAAAQNLVRESADVLRLANLSIPKMRDIAKYETSMLSRDATVRSEASRMNTALRQIANPSTAMVSSDRQKFSTVRQKLVEQQQKGNPVAASIMNASQVSVSSAALSKVATRQSQISKALASSVLSASKISTSTSTASATGAITSAQSRTQQTANLHQMLQNVSNPASITNVSEREKYSKVKQELLTQKEQGNALAASILEAADKVENSSISQEEKTNIENNLLNQIFQQGSNVTDNRQSALANSVLNVSNISSAVTSLQSRQEQTSNLHKMLQNINNPASITNLSEREKLVTVREELLAQKQQGNALAASILEASDKVAGNISEEEKTNIENNLLNQIFEQSTNVSDNRQSALANKVLNVSNISSASRTSVQSRSEQTSNLNQTLAELSNPQAITNTTERERITRMKQDLLAQKEQGNALATSILEASDKMGSVAPVEEKNRMTSQLLDQLLTQEKEDNQLVLDIVIELHIGDLPFVESPREQQMSTVSTLLTKVANPSLETVPSQREKFTRMRENLLTEEKRGNTLATSILEASRKVTSTSIATEEKTKIKDKVLDQLLTEERKRRPAASSVFARPAVVPAMLRQAKLPNVNKVQQVSIDDYEEVRKLWAENYQSLEPPQDLSGGQVERREWIKTDVDKISQTIALLNSFDPKKVEEGMGMVANILPFLLIGGFSKTEVIAYLKAKMEAGKSILDSLRKKEQEEESMVSTQKKTTAGRGTLKEAMEEKISDENQTKDQAGGSDQKSELDQNTETGPSKGEDQKTDKQEDGKIQ